MAQPFNLFAPRPVVAAQQVINGDLNKIQQQTAEAQQRAQQTMQQPVVNAQPQVTPTPKPTEAAQKQQQTYTGGSNNPLGAMDYLNQYTTPEQEEKYRKASVQRQRILAVADALRHIGNIYNTTKYAPAQQFNSPVEMERNRYLQDKALRDKDNYKIMTYQQAKAAQDLKAKQLAQAEADRQQKANQWAATFKFNADKAEADRKEKARQYDETNKLNREKEKRAAEQWQKNYDQKERQHKQSQAVSWYNAKTSRMNAEKNASGNSKGFPLSTPYGQMRTTGNSIPQAQMNQAYDAFERNGWIPKNEWQRVMADLPLGSQETPDYVRNRLVAEVIANNGQAADFMRDNFDFRYENDTRGTGSTLSRPQQQSTYLGYTPDWRGGKSLGTGIGVNAGNNSGMKLGIGL